MIDFYFPKHRIAIEIDELGHADWDSAKENKIQTEIAKYLDCKFIRINPDKKDFSAYDGLGEIFKFIDEFKERKIKTWKKKMKN